MALGVSRVSGRAVWNRGIYAFPRVPAPSLDGPPPSEPREPGCPEMKKLRRRLSSSLNPARFQSDEGLTELSDRLSIRENGSADSASFKGSKLSLFSRATNRFSASASRIPDLRSPLTGGERAREAGGAGRPTKMDIKLLHKSNTFSNFGSQKLGSWFSTFSIARRKNNNGASLKNSKSLSHWTVAGLEILRDSS
ncbi:hypothetical protein HPB47_020490 [Ixodes persulcatus]|uniref:Uncharacterized protein n=1 Tax=Ixodes persulcatus TaxID=34615 RepID=A0AC60QF92_IXOPE|nr:hypothetical protein HPB47_020490 [Ixodes persulcatus]